MAEHGRMRRAAAAVMMQRALVERAIGGDRGIGLFDETGAVTVQGNTISNPGEDGISAWNGSVHIIGNTITGAGGSAIGTEVAADVRIEANELVDNAVAVSVAKGSVQGNSLSGSETGIRLDGTAEASDNEIMDGGIGIEAVAGTPTITGNTIRGNDQGLLVAAGATPSLLGNAICDNGTNLVGRRARRLPM